MDSGTFMGNLRTTGWRDIASTGDLEWQSVFAKKNASARLFKQSLPPRAPATQRGPRSSFRLPGLPEGCAIQRAQPAVRGKKAVGFKLGCPVDQADGILADFDYER